MHRGVFVMLLVFAGLLGGCGKKGPTASAVATASATPSAASASTARAPLKIAYSDWPGWVAWDVAVAKGFFEEAGVPVAFQWLEYAASMEAFSEGKADAVCMTNGDALVSASSGAASVGILINDFSNGNDMIVAKPGIKHLGELKGKKVGVEVGFVDHLLLMEALKANGLAENDVEIVNAKTVDTPALLKAGTVSAIAAWQPNSGRALELVPGATSIFSSADVPGLIYDLLFVSPASLKARRDDWLKVVRVWFKTADFIRNPAHRAEAAQIMSKRVGITPERYEKLMGGTQLLGKDENLTRYRTEPGFGTVHGSSEIVDRFNVANKVYRESLKVDPYLDSSLAHEAATTP